MLKKFIIGFAIGAMVLFGSGCTRIETGYVGLRVS